MAQRKSIMIVAGEASADRHGAQLVEHLLLGKHDIDIWGVGGAAMRAKGFEASVRAEQISVAGLTEVLFAIPRIWLIMRKLVRMVKERKPSVVVLIDLPDFNLRLAKKIKRFGVPIVYYISPQIWAWRQKRVEQIRKVVSQMLVILPFEQTFYQKHGIRARFVGHPLVEDLPNAPDRNEAKATLGLSTTQTPVVALLPGSRRKEITRNLPIMLSSIRRLKRHYPDILAIIPIASTVPQNLIHKFVRSAKISAIAIQDRATDVLSAADVAIVCSGTATLQAALLSRPMVVVYKVSWLTYQILKRLVKTAHIAIVNLIAGRRLVPELIQNDFTAQNVEEEVRKILEDPLIRIRLKQDFGEIRKQLGRGNTAATVAKVVSNYLPNKTNTTQEVEGVLTAVRVTAKDEDD